MAVFALGLNANVTSNIRWCALKESVCWLVRVQPWSLPNRRQAGGHVEDCITASDHPVVLEYSGANHSLLRCANVHRSARSRMRLVTVKGPFRLNPVLRKDSPYVGRLPRQGVQRR